MRQLAHDARHADAAAEKAALRAFQRKVVRVTLLVLVGMATLAGWWWVQQEPTHAAFEWLGSGLLALLVLKLVLGVLPAELLWRVVLRILHAPSASMAVVRAYYWFLGFMLVMPMGVHRSDTWGVDAAAFTVFFAYAFISGRRRRSAPETRHEDQS